MAQVLMKPQLMAIAHLVISPIRELIKIWSPKVFIHGIPWQLLVHKDEDEKSLAVHLQCTKEDDSSNWTVSASAKITLMPFDEKKNAFVRYIEPFVFNSSCYTFGYASFIEWDELLKDGKYVRDDTIELKMEIMAEDPNYVDKSKMKFETIDKSCDCGSLARFRLTVTNIRNLMAVRSSQFTVRGFAFEVSVYKSSKSTFGVSLDSINTNDDTTEEFSCNAKVSVKLLSSKNGVNPIKKSVEDQLKSDGCLNLVNLISCDEMFKPQNGFVNNDSIILEVKITLDKPEGDVPNNAAKRRRFQCSICLESLDTQDMSTTPCGHSFCTECITKALRNRRVCPLCKAKVRSNSLRRLYLSAE